MAGVGNGIKANETEKIFEHYDEIIISSRVLESFVTIAPKLEMRASDILFFSQKTSSHKDPDSILKEEDKRKVDERIKAKTGRDKLLFDMAEERLNTHLRLLPDKIKRILNDIPEMIIEVKKECGHIDPFFNSCIDKQYIPRGSVAICLSRCIEKWADNNIYCKT